MHEKQAKFVRFGVFLFATAAVALSLSGQQSSRTRTSLVTDWSSRHLIFSAPSTYGKLAAVSQDPRYQQQWLRRNMHPAPPTDGEESAVATEPRSTAIDGLDANPNALFGPPSGGLGSKSGGGPMKKDWSTSLGPSATVGADSYPAKFSFDSTTASCANDFVVYGTSVNGAAAGATATASGTFSGVPNDGETATLTYGSGSVATVTASAATAATGSGSFTANPSTGQTATIGGTLVLHSVPGGQITFSGEPNAADTVTVGATTYTFQNSCGSGPACVVRSGTTNTNATNLAHAISNGCNNGTHSDCNVSGANGSVTGAAVTNVVTLTSVASPPAAYTLSENAANTTVATGARGTGSNTGTNFVIGVTNATSVIDNDAASLAADIASNGGGVGVTAASSGATVTVTATTAGTGANGKTLTEALSNFTWASGTMSGGAAPQSGSNFFAITNATGTNLSTTTIASNFATAVGAQATANKVPVTASPSGSAANLTSSVPGSLGNGVALTDTLTNFSWNHTTLQGGAGQASIVAYNNLYSSCGGTVPSTYWSYFTNGTVQTSPTLSLDGKQVAFVQTTGGVANLVLLKWASASVTAGSPVTLTTTTASNYSACTAPCMLTLTFNGSPNDTNSSPYYDYSGDAIYVGDDNGTVHKFTPIFNGGTPAEITTSPWPIALTNSTGMQTTSPVYAINNGIYIGTAKTSFGGTTGGYFYRINPTTGALTVSSEIASRPGIVDAPVVDPSAGVVYVFAGSDTNFGDCGGFTPCSGVFQFTTSFTAGSGGTEQEVGSGSAFTAVPMFTGDFDNTYFNSSDPPTGNLYVCGDAGGDARIYRIHITTNTMSAPVAGPTLTSAAATCSPMTEAFSGTTDMIFVNVQDNGNLGSCGGGGCVMSFNITSGTLPSGTAPTASLPENGGTSGMVIDTLGSGTSGANQVYFSPLAMGQVCPSGAGCAVQASQSGLN